MLVCRGSPKPKTAKNVERFASSHALGASPNLPAMTVLSSVASLSKRTTEATFNPVPGVGAMGTVFGPVRGTEVMKHTITSVRASLSRETTRAGLRLSPDRLVNGKRVKTMLPKANTQSARCGGCLKSASL